MNIGLLKDALSVMKRELEASITSAEYNGRSYENGQRAKEALIRSQSLIQNLHEVVKVSVYDEILRREKRFAVFPDLGRTSPELKLYGLIKGKNQDLVFLPSDIPSAQTMISDGPLKYVIDPIGEIRLGRAIVIGVRSQLSSVDNNFDTLMERAFAETLNLRLRIPEIVMGEVYLLPVIEYNKHAMLQNTVAWTDNVVQVEKFISTFLGISGRTNNISQIELYKYDRSALVLVDFRDSPPTVLLTTDDLRQRGLIPRNSQIDFTSLSPSRFAEDIVGAYVERFPSH